MTKKGPTSNEHHIIPSSFESDKRDNLPKSIQTADQLCAYLKTLPNLLEEIKIALIQEEIALAVSRTTDSSNNEIRAYNTYKSQLIEDLFDKLFPDSPDLARVKHVLSYQKDFPFRVGVISVVTCTLVAAGIKQEDIFQHLPTYSYIPLSSGLILLVSYLFTEYKQYLSFEKDARKFANLVLEEDIVSYTKFLLTFRGMENYEKVEHDTFAHALIQGGMELESRLQEDVVQRSTDASKILDIN